jgi:hypothetical protein
MRREPGMTPAMMSEQLADPIDAALALLLAKDQIEFVRSKTKLGYSRKEVLRKLVRIGMDGWADSPNG